MAGFRCTYAVAFFSTGRGVRLCMSPIEKFGDAGRAFVVCQICADARHRRLRNRRNNDSILMRGDLTGRFCDRLELSNILRELKEGGCELSRIGGRVFADKDSRLAPLSRRSQVGELAEKRFTQTRKARNDVGWIDGTSKLVPFQKPRGKM